MATALMQLRQSPGLPGGKRSGALLPRQATTVCHGLRPSRATAARLWALTPTPLLIKRSAARHLLEVLHKVRDICDARNTRRKTVSCVSHDAVCMEGYTRINSDEAVCWVVPKRCSNGYVCTDSSLTLAC